MRVITGSARGRKLKSPADESVRPTSDRVKEAVFSIIQFELEGRRVLDLFAGSGQMGIEALSRGAERAVFVDSSKEAIGIVKDNLASTKLSENAVVLHADALAFLRESGQIFDIIFADPPYKEGIILKMLPLAAARVAPGGILMVETPYGEKLPETAGDLTRTKEYKYGKTAITTYR
jgi:16S rRNA (guanine(966)-N(2))-methyltransferase RsmD